MKLHVQIQGFDSVIPNSPWFFPVKSLDKLGGDLARLNPVVGGELVFFEFKLLFQLQKGLGR